MKPAQPSDRSSSGDDHGDIGHYPDDVIATVGQFAGPPPQLPGIRYVSGLDQPCGLVALLPGCDPIPTLFTEVTITWPWSVRAILADAVGFVTSVFRDSPTNSQRFVADAL